MYIEILPDNHLSAYFYKTNAGTERGSAVHIHTLTRGVYMSTFTHLYMLICSHA